MKPWAIATLLLLPALASGQTKDEVSKVSNDQPARPLQMPPASTEVKEAFDDFDRFQRRGAWERALKALQALPEEQTARFVDGESGWIITAARKRRSVLAALPADGQAAYRLFYDSEAKKLFDEADGSAELTNLERLYSAYFLTSVGDNAADRLGNLYFERGQFDRAADCWLAILRERPDSELAPGLIAVKAALALARAGRGSDSEQVRSEIADRYSDEKVTVGGQTGAPGEVLRRLLEESGISHDNATAAPDPSRAGPELSGTVEALWQVRFAESVEAGMTAPELTRWESNALSNAVPAVAVAGSKLFANYLGYAFAVDLKSGKLLWRSAAFHHLEVPAMQDQVRMLVDATRYATVASEEHVWTLGRDLRDQNFMAPYHLTCRRVEGGDVVWQSTDLPDYAQLDLVGPPLLTAGKLFIAAKTLLNPQQGGRPPQEFVLAIQPHDGKLLWKTEIGSFRQAQQMYFYYGNMDPSPQPQIIYRSGAVYVDTHVGVLARLDADSGALDWGFGYPTEPLQGQNRFFFVYDESRETGTACGPPLAVGAALLVKGVGSDRLNAVDPNHMKALWDRPISKSSRLLGAIDGVAFLGGPELSALDLKTRKLLWATRVPNGSAEGRVLVRADGLWQLTPRGIFELDPKSGTVRRIMRGNDLGAVGGDLLLTDELLVSVSNRALSAYPRRASANPNDPASPPKRASQ